MHEHIAFVLATIAANVNSRRRGLCGDDSGADTVAVAQGGALTTIAAPGTPTPTTGVVAEAHEPTLNNKGVVKFVGSLVGGGAGIFAGSGGPLTTIALNSTSYLAGINDLGRSACVVTSDSVPWGDGGPPMIVASTGAFYVRVHAITASERSGPSNEIQIFVNTPTPPSAPGESAGARQRHLGGADVAAVVPRRRGCRPRAQRHRLGQRITAAERGDKRQLRRGARRNVHLERQRVERGGHEHAVECGDGDGAGTVFGRAIGSRRLSGLPRRRHHLRRVGSTGERSGADAVSLDGQRRIQRQLHDSGTGAERGRRSGILRFERRGCQRVRHQAWATAVQTVSVP